MNRRHLLKITAGMVLLPLGTLLPTAAETRERLPSTVSELKEWMHRAFQVVPIPDAGLKSPMIVSDKTFSPTPPFSYNCQEIRMRKVGLRVAGRAAEHEVPMVQAAYRYLKERNTGPDQILLVRTYPTLEEHQSLLHDTTTSLLWLRCGFGN